MSDIATVIQNVRKQIEKVHGVGSVVEPSDPKLAERLGSNIPSW